MTTFHAVLFALVGSVTTFLPVSDTAHRLMLAHALEIEVAPHALMAAITAGSLFAVVIRLRHDLLSLISSLLRVVLLWNKPMSLDERLPFFIAISSLPALLLFWGLSPILEFAPLFIRMNWGSPAFVAVALALGGAFLYWSEYRSRRLKSMVAWNAVDAAITGAVQLFSVIPGFGLHTGALAGALLRNYHREAAAKYSLYLLIVLLSLRLWKDWSSLLDALALETTSPLTLGAAGVASFFGAFVASEAFLKAFTQKGASGTMIYRLVIAGSAASLFYYRGVLGFALGE